MKHKTNLAPMMIFWCPQIWYSSIHSTARTSL